MEFVNSDVWTDLTEEEITALNGGVFCRPVINIICRPSPPPFSRRVCARRIVYVCS